MNAKGDSKCGTPHLTDEVIKAKFLEAYSQLLPDRDRLIDECRKMQQELTDSSEIDREKGQLLQELEVVAELTKRCLAESSTLKPEETVSRANGLSDRFSGLQDRIAALDRKKSERLAKADAIGGFMFRLKELDQPLEHFDDRLWLEVIDCVVVNRDGTLDFRFQDGTEIRV